MKIVDSFSSHHPSWEIVAAGLALMTRTPFNPDATHPATGKPLLHSIIASVGRNVSQPVIEGRVLPITLQDLEKVAKLGTTRHGTPVDAEWLAAIVLASGADPWVVHRTQQSHDGYDALDLAIEQNLPMLVDVLLNTPGAPLAHKRTASLPPSSMRGGALNWWSTLAAQSGRLQMLEVLAKHGAAYDALDAEGNHPLGGALPEVVEWYAKQGWLPTDPAIQTRLQAQWVARSKQSGLSLDDLKKMSAFLLGEQGALVEHRKAQIGRLLTRQPGYDTTPRGFTLEELLARIEVPRGPSRGHWTGLGALVVAYLRGASQTSAPDTFDWSNQPGSSVAKCTWLDGKWSRPDWVGQPGVLGPALGVEWKPGISLDGALALQLCLAPDFDSPSSQLAVMLGVDSPRAWVQTSLGDASRFTVALLEKSKAESLQQGLVWAWSKVASVIPDPNEWGSDGWKHAYEVGVGLRCGNRLPPTPKPQSYDIQARLKEWYDVLLVHQPLSDEDKSYAVLMAIERAMLVPTKGTIGVACDWLLDASLSKNAQMRVADYAQWPELDDGFQKMLAASASASRLQETLEAVDSPRIKPRF